jgi:hypothetical protein
MMNYYWQDCRYWHQVNEQGEIVNTGGYVCFGDMLEPSRTSFYRRKENPAIYLDHFFVSNVPPKEAAKFLSRMKRMGLFRNVSISKVPFEEIPANLQSIIKVYSKKDEHEYYRLRADVRVCSAQEYHVVGFIIREMENNPRPITNWSNLIKLHPKVDKFLLYLISHNIRPDDWMGGSGNYAAGHQFIPLGFTHIVDTSIKKVFALMDSHNYPPIKTGTSRMFIGGLVAQFCRWNGSYGRSSGGYNPKTIEYYLETKVTT